jgi:hypothetical protein
MCAEVLLRAVLSRHTATALRPPEAPRIIPMTSPHAPPQAVAWRLQLNPHSARRSLVNREASFRRFVVPFYSLIGLRHALIVLGTVCDEPGSLYAVCPPHQSLAFKPWLTYRIVVAHCKA